VTREISERWKSLSQEDRVTITAECVQEIEEERETKSLATHNVPLRAFYDARSTLQVVEKEVRSGTLSYLRSLISQRSTFNSDSYLTYTQELDSNFSLSLVDLVPRIS
jgi:hypothetical protein